MNGPDSILRHEGLLSIAVLGLFFAQSCLEVEMTTHLEPDGSGRMALHMSASEALMQMGGEGGDVSADDLQFSEEEIREMREAADTLPGIHFDTAYSERRGGRSHMVVRFAFDSVAAVQGVLERRGTDRFNFPTLRQTERTVRLSYHPVPLPGTEGGGGDPFGAMGREMVMQMLDVRFRYEFPEGTSVDSARPAVQQTDSMVVYELGMRDILDASESRDSLFVAATLPESGSDLALWIVLGAVVILGGGIVILFARRAR